MFGNLGFPELIVILVIVVVLFGVNKLPRLGKGLGEGIRNFRDSVRSGSTGADEPSDPEQPDERARNGAVEPR